MLGFAYGTHSAYNFGRLLLPRGRPMGFSPQKRGGGDVKSRARYGSSPSGACDSGLEQLGVWLGYALGGAAIYCPNLARDVRNLVRDVRSLVRDVRNLARDVRNFVSCGHEF